MRLNINIHRLIKHVSSIGILAGLLTCFVPVACIAQETNHFIQKEDTAIYGKKGDVMPDTWPEYPGGMPALFDFFTGQIDAMLKRLNLSKAHFNYGHGVPGRTIVQFIIEKDGSVKHVKVLRGVDPKLDEEAIGFIHVMPEWKPGVKDDKPVRVLYTVPISWHL